MRLDARLGGGGTDGVGNGIDIRADLLRDADFDRVAGARQYAALLCCNVLEHVHDPGESRAAGNTFRPGGIIKIPENNSKIEIPNNFSGLKMLHKTHAPDINSPIPVHNMSAKSGQ